MKNIITSLVFVVSFLFLFSFSADKNKYHNDCALAYQICQLDDFYFPSFNSSGINEDLGLDNSKLKETNSIWLRFKAATSGEMNFVIVPDDSDDDIDFVLYEGELCDSKSPIRVMTSGETIGQNEGMSCIGQTGLQNVSTDLSESDGCYEADDNYLSPVFVDSREEYYLLINNYNSSKGFTILFDGDENLKLQDDCSETTSDDFEFEIYPNPTVDEVNLSLPDSFSEPIKVQLFDQLGRLLHDQKYENLKTPLTFNVSDYSAGKYIFRVTHESEVRLKSFIKQ